MRSRCLVPMLALVVVAGCSQHSNFRESARYRIVQSTLAAKGTFRLDMRTGHVSQLVQSTKDEDLTWEEMRVSGLPPAAESGDHYQIFTSGIAAKFTFLINTDTGKTWQLQSTSDPTTKEDTYLWVPFDK